MGTLEPQFRKLHWPPLVREVTQTKQYPGYRYEYFRTFRELNEYFIKLCGTAWREEPWAKYWFNQHMETKNDDRRDPNPIKPKGPTGNRRDTPLLIEIARQWYKETKKLSSGELTRHFATLDLKVSRDTSWRIIKKIKSEQNDI